MDLYSTIHDNATWCVWNLWSLVLVVFQWFLVNALCNYIVEGNLMLFIIGGARRESEACRLMFHQCLTIGKISRMEIMFLSARERCLIVHTYSILYNISMFSKLGNPTSDLCFIVLALDSSLFGTQNLIGFMVVVIAVSSLYSLSRKSWNAKPLGISQKQQNMKQY